MSDAIQAAQLIAYTLAISIGLLILTLGLNLGVVGTIAVAIMPMIAVVLLDRGTTDGQRTTTRSWSR